MRSCLNCGTEFDRHPKRRRSAPIKCCSSECAAAYARSIKYAEQKTTCKNGHPFTAENTFVRPNGYRDCRTCRRARNAKYRDLRHPVYERTPAQVERQVCLRTTKNEATRTTADRHGHQWTGPELEIASRQDLSHEYCAKMLGRTMRAVETKRCQLRVSLKVQLLAGI